MKPHTTIGGDRALLRTLFLLHIKRDDSSLVQKLSHFFKVLFQEAARRHGRGSDSSTSGRKSRAIAEDSILVQSDVAEVAHFFVLGACEAQWSQVPQDKMIVSSVGDKVVSLALQELSQSRSVLLHLRKNEGWIER